MRKMVQGLLAVLFLWVAALSTVRLDIVEATCASVNNIDASDNGAETDGDGDFIFELSFEWELTFNPIFGVVEVHPSGGTSSNVSQLSYDPAWLQLTSDDCISDAPVVVEVTGKLTNTQQGNVNSRIWLVASGNQYEEPHATFIPAP